MPRVYTGAQAAAKTDCGDAEITQQRSTDLALNAGDHQGRPYGGQTAARVASVGTALASAGSTFCFFGRPTNTKS